MQIEPNFSSLSLLRIDPFARIPKLLPDNLSVTPIVINIVKLDSDWETINQVFERFSIFFRVVGKRATLLFNNVAFSRTTRTKS